MVGNNHVNRELVREVLERPELKLVPHVGYVSLFPFMARIIPPVSFLDGLMTKLRHYQFSGAFAMLSL